MRARHYAVLVAGALTLGACAAQQEDVIAPAPPPGPGAIFGSVAADRDGDGLVDGYYTSDGIYHAIQGPPCPPPPPPPPLPPRRSGERG